MPAGWAQFHSPDGLLTVCAVCRYDHYRGVVCVVAVKDGSIGVGEYGLLLVLHSVALLGSKEL